MVFQDYALYPHMTVRENMSLGLKLRKVPPADIHRRVEHAAELLNLHSLMNRRPSELSGGQQQRVAVGRAIVRQPACFLFDEPLSNLDARLRLHMRAELKSLHQRLQTTTLYVTHDQEEAMTLGTRIVVMADGNIQQIGTPLEVYRHPCNRFVAGFLGTPPMNFVPGEMHNDEFRGGGLTFSFDGIARSGPTVVGIRPEALVINGDGVPIVLTVEVVEPLGDRMDLYLRTTEGIPMTARVPASDDVKPGSMIGMTVELAAVYLFERGDFGASLR
jgi:multiple sugar transport system ATP-binding protein